MQGDAAHVQQDPRQAWAWRRPRARRRRRGGGRPPPGPPLLLWVHALARQGAVPAAAVHVAMGYMIALDDMCEDTQLSAAFRQQSAQLLRGSVGRAKAHSFLHLVLEDACGGQ